MSRSYSNRHFQGGVPPQPTFNVLGTADFDHYQPYELGLDEHISSQFPESQAYPSASPPLSNSQLPSDPTRSPISSQLHSPDPRPRYTEVESPDPERAYTPQDEKEKYVLATAQPPYYFQDPSILPPPPTPPNQVQLEPLPQDQPFYKRRSWILAILALIAAVAIAVPCGVVFGTKHPPPTPLPTNPTSSIPPSPSGTTTSSSTPQPTGDPNYAIGGQLSPAYFSKEGAFNGTGIAIAAANPGVDGSIYVFYQDWQGALQYSVSNPTTGMWTPLGPVNYGVSTALNGTPLSAVAYINDTVATWHLFYIDVDYTIRQRSLINDTYTPTWGPGPIGALGLKTNEADTIGMQACYWGNFYGDATDTYTDGLNGTSPHNSPEIGMHL